MKSVGEEDVDEAGDRDDARGDMGVGGGGEDKCENDSDTGVAGEFMGGKGIMAEGIGGGTLYI